MKYLPSLPLWVSAFTDIEKCILAFRNDKTKVKQRLTIFFSSTRCLYPTVTTTQAQFQTGTIKLLRSDVSEEIIRGVLALWGVRQQGLSKMAGGFQTLSTVFFLFCFFQHRLFNITARYYLKKTGGSDDKTKIVLFEYFIAFVSGKLVETFLDIHGLSFRILELTFL